MRPLPDRCRSQRRAARSRPWRGLASIGTGAAEESARASAFQTRPRHPDQVGCS
jgi:hypothetical protein